jgi:hypothetical protein
MDRREQEAFAGTLSAESNNVRLDGFFSVQVLSCARRGGSDARCVGMRAFSLSLAGARVGRGLACLGLRFRRRLRGAKACIVAHVLRAGDLGGVAKAGLDMHSYWQH